MLITNTLKEVMVWEFRDIVKLKVEGRGETTEQSGNHPFDLTAGCHTMFVYCDLVQNEILGVTQTAFFRAVPVADNKRHRTFTRFRWR